MFQIAIEKTKKKIILIRSDYQKLGQNVLLNRMIFVN